MRDVLKIADEMLKVAKRRGEQLTPMQLMKLVYIAHGFRLGRDGVPLFPNRIEAWKYGPVVPDLYHSTKKFGRGVIPFDLIGNASAASPEIPAFLEEVYNVYGRFSAITLSSLTHQAGSPWAQVYKPHELGIEIPDEIIKRYYEQKFASTDTAA